MIEEILGFYVITDSNRLQYERNATSPKLEKIGIVQDRPRSSKVVLDDI